MLISTILLTRDKPRLLWHFYQEGFFIEPCEPPDENAFFVGVNMRICKVNDCNRKHRALGYCHKHYERFKKHGDPLYSLTNKNPPEICTIEGCNNKHRSKGYCEKHYDKFKKYGDPLHTKIESHGMTKTSEYSVWRDMKQRCNNPKLKSFKDYGGRGITVCDRWNNSFIAFLKDMGEKPFPEAQLDRRDNDEGYCKNNCRWVTRIVNMNNIRCLNRRAIV